MSELWLQIVGIGEDGLTGLTPAARAAVESAEVIFGARRHHDLTAEIQAERVEWPSPFDALVDTLDEYEGRATVVLATGDPLWRSVGSRLVRAFPESVVHPHVSAYQLASARMNWSMDLCETLTVHGRPVSILRPFVQPGQKLLILAANGDSAEEVGAALTEWGFGESRMTALSHLESQLESWAEAPAKLWGRGRMNRPGDLCTLAVDCRADPDAPLQPRVPGLADDLFAHDGVMTKREIRAMALAKLAPMPGQLLWDVGCGCGSVAVEWMRAAPRARAIGIEPRADRRALAAANAQSLGTPGLEIREGEAPAALADLPPPDAVFLGGGLSEAAAEAALAALAPRGRLVAHAVTLESEALLLALHARHGGEMTRISVERAVPVGGRQGWKPAMAVTQWSVETR